MAVKKYSIIKIVKGKSCPIVVRDCDVGSNNCVRARCVMECGCLRVWIEAEIEWVQYIYKTVQDGHVSQIDLPQQERFQGVSRFFFDETHTLSMMNIKGQYKTDQNLN